MGMDVVESTRDEEMDEIWLTVADGTPIEIRP